MNDAHYLNDATNRHVSNALVLFSIALAFLLAIVSIPLQIFGGR